MFSITSTRLKKAVLNPKGALIYLKNYLKGEILKLKLKFNLLPKKIDLSYLSKERNYKFFTDNEDFLKEIANQDFIIETAERILNNEFGFLGINPKQLKEIEWNKDIGSGHLWPNEFYLDLRENLSKDFGKGWDIKNVWELSRFHYLIPLSLAYYLTGKQKYLNKWQELISDWIRNNPVYYGPNWLIAMEVAIRACNWLFSYEIIQRRTVLLQSGEFGEMFQNSLFEHGRFIFNNLEFAPIKSNHYLSDIVGLVYLGVFFQKTKEGKKWLNFANKALEEEIKNQVYDDGVDYELSISYHRYKTELFLWAFWLLKINGFEISEETAKKLVKMVDFVKIYTKPNDLAPQIGDSDDSRLHLIWEDFYHWEKRNHFAVLKLFFYFKEKKPQEQPLKISEEINSFFFPQAKFLIASSNDFYFITGRGEACNGKGGSHTHNDILSFELNVNGEDIIVDPGTYVYTKDTLLRNRFRSSRQHNVCFINNEEQNELTRDIFYYPQKNKLKVLEHSENESKIIFSGQLNSYFRKFIIDKKEKSLEIEDKILGDNLNLEWNFHLAPQIKIWLKEKTERKFREIILLGEKTKLIFRVSNDLDCVIIEDEVSPSYGVKVPTKTIKLSGFLSQSSPKEFKFKMEPIKNF